MNNDNSFFFPLIVVVLFVTAVFFGLVSFFHVTEHSNCMVSGKDRVSVSNSNGSRRSEMRVYTDNCGTMTLKDTWLRGVFNSADMYGSIHENESYDFTTYGFRVPILSNFPVITKVEN